MGIPCAAQMDTPFRTNLEMPLRDLMTLFRF